MRVALLALNACAGDAIGNQLAGKVRFFTQRGWVVRLFVESTDRLHPDVAGVVHQTDGETLWADPEQRRFLCEADLVVAEFGVSFSLLHLLPALATKPPRIIIEYHGLTPAELWEPSQRWRLGAAQEDRNLVWCADRVIVKSRFTERELIAATGMSPERISRVPCFVDEDRFTNEAQSKAGKDARPTERVLLYVGRLAKNKCVPLLVEAVARLTHEEPAVHAVILGDAGDAYAAEAERCRVLAAELGVAERVHWLGHVSDAELIRWYGTAEVLVMPSMHEGFCVPVIEAMACGLPVVAARAGALPETLGSAGLSFAPESVDDLVRQVRRVLCPQPSTPHPRPLSPEYRGEGGRIAVVAGRFGHSFAGGAERSLARIAKALQAAGYTVEVFTTCAADEQGVINSLPAGTTSIDGLTVHRFPTDPRDLDCWRRFAERRRGAMLAGGEEATLLANALNSHRLADELARRRDEFDAVIVGPYVHGLTWQVARRLGPQTLLLPCFHDEPLARLPALLAVYREVSGILYHTPEEQHFAEAELGINQPNSVVIGTWLDADAGSGDAERGQSLCGEDYLVYCGRYGREKGFDRLLEWMRRAQEQAPGLMRLVVMGQNEANLPDEPWLLQLGYVTEMTKREVIAGARALVLLSENESLSIVALEAWAEGVPVIASRGCEVLRGQITRSGGGCVVGSCTEFAETLIDLRIQSPRWRRRGAAGRDFVQRHCFSRESFVERITQALRQRVEPLPTLMRRRGLERAAEFTRQRWERRFATLLEELSADSAAPSQTELRIEPVTSSLSVSPGTQRALVPVRVTNVGTSPAGAKGPAAVRLLARVAGLPTSTLPREARGSCLAALLPPAISQVVVLPLVLPQHPGTYQVEFDMEHAASGQCSSKPLTLVVAAEHLATDSGPANQMLASVRKGLGELHDLKTLPDDYQDVTHGALADWKRLIKRKLLHNFRTAYVDVLSRRQSHFNEQLLTALCQLTDCIAVQRQAPPSASETDLACELLQKTLRRQRRLERRLARLEEQLEALARTCP